MTEIRKHTIAPWRIEDRTNRGAGHTIYSPQAHFSCANVAHYISKADAAVICVAPEALEVCRLLIKTDDLQAAIDLARQVLDRHADAETEPQRTVI